MDDATGDNLDSGLTEALAWKDLQFALDTFSLSAGADESTRINVKNTNIYVVETTIDDNTTNADANNVLVIQGYTTTIGDGGKFILDCDDGGTQAVNCVDGDTAFDHRIWKDFHMRQSSGTVFQLDSDFSIIENGILDGGTDGVFLSISDFAINIEVKNSSDDGIEGGGDNTMLIYSYIHDITDHTIASTPRVFYNILDTSIDNVFNPGYFIGNTIYNMTSSENVILSGDQTVWLNNIFDTASGNNVTIQTTSTLKMYGYNNLSTNGGTGLSDASNNIVVNLGGNQTLSPGFTNAPNQDFSIGANLDDLGYPTTFLGSSTTRHHEIGAVMYEETAGGGAEPSSGYSN